MRLWLGLRCDEPSTGGPPTAAEIVEHDTHGRSYIIHQGVSITIQERVEGKANHDTKGEYAYWPSFSVAEAWLVSVARSIQPASSPWFCIWLGLGMIRQAFDLSQISGKKEGIGLGVHIKLMHLSAQACYTLEHSKRVSRKRPAVTTRPLSANRTLPSP